MMYLDGFRQEGIIKDNSEYVPQAPPSNPRHPDFGKPQDLGPQKVDPAKLPTRAVQLKAVNWGPPE